MLKKFAEKYIITLRIPSVSRISLSNLLLKQFKRLRPGVVLDMGSGNPLYQKNIPNTKYLRLDIDEKTNPDICCDAHEIKWESNYFDTVISTELLEHLYEPQKAINEIHRVLKKDGVCIASTRFICHYHKSPLDYYRYTQDSLRYLFRDFKRVEIYPHGSRIQAVWQLLNLGVIKIVLNIFNPLIARINFKNTRTPCGFVVYAVK